MSDTTSTRTIKTRIQHKHDTAANWATNNPELLPGEFGIESDTGRMKIGRKKEDKNEKWNDLIYTDVYSNDTPIVTSIGSIREGDTFYNVSIQDMLTRILYPYIPIELGTFNDSDEAKWPEIVPSISEPFAVHQLPTLTSVSLYVKKNSATNITFELYERHENGNEPIYNKIKALNGEDVINNRIVFTDGAEDDDNVLAGPINTTRDLVLVCSYLGEDKNGEPEQKVVELGQIKIKFIDPEISTLTALDDSDKAITKLNYFNGQSVALDKITASLTLNSTVAEGFRVNKLSLTKFSKNNNGNYTQEGELVGQVSNPDLNYSNSYSYSFTNLDTTISKDTKYEVAADYNKRDGDSTTPYPGKVKKSFEIKFTHNPATIDLEGISSISSISKLEPTSISGLKAKFKKNSDKITKVKLIVDSTLSDYCYTEEIEVPEYNNTTYNNTAKEITFSYNRENICSDLTFNVEMYNNDGKLNDTDKAELHFIAPWCYGWVETSGEKPFTIDSVTAKVLDELGNYSLSKETHIKLSAPDKSKKFLYAVPVSGGTFTSAKDGANEENFGLFDTAIKSIEFSDGSTVNYQIILQSGTSKGAVNLKFS